MTESDVLVAAAVTGLAWLAGGLGLVVRRSAVPAAALLAGAGAALLAAAGLTEAGRTSAAQGLLVAAGLLVCPLALATYPRVRWRHPVDFVALTTLGGSGVVALLSHRANGGVVLQSSGLVTGLALIAHTWWRLERSTGRERRSLQWMALALGAAGLISGLVTFAGQSPAAYAVSVALFAVLGPALYVGVAAPEVVDVRALVVGVVVQAVALLGYLASFVLLAGSVQLLGGGAALSLGVLGLIGGLVATTFHPVQVLLHGVVDELLFGTRPDPLEAATRVVGAIGDDPARALQAIRETLVLPHASLMVDGTAVASSGEPVTQVRRFALAGMDGELVVGLRAGDLRLSRKDEQVLHLVVPLLVQTLRSRAVARDLLESRQQTVSAIEEERRRLRRDLHDGLGPRLSGIAFTSDAARNLVHDDPDRADELLASLRAETVGAIEEIRELVYAMRPPALDELGLVPALRQQALGLRSRDGAPLAVSVSAPDDLSPLPAAVEVAAYRIVVEALTNVARHSASRSAAVRLVRTPGGLGVEVADNGGPGGAWRPGVGMSSMAERAAELGGTFAAGPGDGGGRVQAFLPTRNGSGPAEPPG